MSSPAAPAHLIELSVRDLPQLFNSMDPSPFHDKDLDRAAEEFIVSWSREYPLNEPVTLRVHLTTWPAEDPTPLIREAMHNFFESKRDIAQLEFRRLMRQGRISLTIGLLFLAACLVAVRLLAGNPAGITSYLRESLTIAGWVAMWKPMEIYLYDWWPVRWKVRNFARLSTMPVEVVAKAPAKEPA